MGEEYGPHFGAGDTIGAGLHLEAQELFFTCAFWAFFVAQFFCSLELEGDFWLPLATCLVLLFVRLAGLGHQKRSRAILGVQALQLACKRCSDHDG